METFRHFELITRRKDRILIALNFQFFQKMKTFNISLIMRRKDRILVASNFQFSQKMEILSTLNTLTPNNEEERSNSNRLELSIFQKMKTLD